MRNKFCGIIGLICVIVVICLTFGINVGILIKNNKYYNNSINATIINYHQISDNNYCVEASYINANGYTIDCLLYDNSLIMEEKDMIEKNYQINKIFAVHFNNHYNHCILNQSYDEIKKHADYMQFVFDIYINIRFYINNF